MAAADQQWLDEFYHAIFRSDPPRYAYQNSPDPQLTHWRRASYGRNYQRLVEVKHAYDPSEFFHYPQAIGT